MKINLVTVVCKTPGAEEEEDIYLVFPLTTASCCFSLHDEILNKR